MEENVDLKAIERKIFKTSNQDGLMDIYFGVLILSMGIQALSRELIPGIMGNLGVYMILLGSAFAFFVIGKKKITGPRMGIVKLSLRTSPTKRKMVLFLGINVVLSFIFLILTMLGLFDIIEINPLFLMLTIGLGLLTLPISLFAYYSKTPRWYFIAVPLGFCFFFAELLYPIVGNPLDSVIVFSVMGGGIIVMGVVVLIRFLKKYPLSKEE